MKRLALAIARENRGHPGLIGIARQSNQGLAILHQAAPDDIRTPSLETLQDYASTLAALHARETILPLRFGSIHESERDLDDWLRVHADEWRAQLDAVDDCDEMGLRVLIDPPAERSDPPPAINADRPGTSYLQALKARHDRSDATRAEADRMADWLRDSLGPTYRQSVSEPPGPGRERLLSMTFLVPRPQLNQFRAATQPLTIALPGRIILTGPWPPYHFTDRAAVATQDSGRNNGKICC